MATKHFIYMLISIGFILTAIIYYKSFLGVLSKDEAIYGIDTTLNTIIITALGWAIFNKNK